ncbi:unnamed protein product [Alopecurus aequalis]
MNIPYLLFKKVTNNFSDDRIIGEGGFGKVYKGELEDGELIAVKMLHPLQGLNDELFQNEVCNILFKDGHPNIIELLGYCDEIHSEFVEYHGKKLSSKHVYRGMCFEYFPSGSLHKHLVGTMKLNFIIVISCLVINLSICITFSFSTCAEKSLAPNWSTRYSIIKGICEGLNFLHGREKPIFHLDLKPDNILLDSFMVPKLADFGLSRLFAQSRTHVTRRTIGTDMYMPPEYIMAGTISSQNDVFSFGVVMIEIMEGYSLFQQIDDVTQFKKEVLAKCSSMIEPTSEYRKNKLIHQVRTCIDTAMHCVDSERKNRPSIGSILDTLNDTEIDIPNTQLSIVPLFPIINLRNSLAETLNNWTTELNNITNSLANMEQNHDIREASSNFEESLIIGRIEEKKKILSILFQSRTDDMVILPIYGIGGIGKTTLAKLVFNDTQFSAYSRVWIKVSKTLDLNRIGNSIISLLTNNVSNIADDQMLNKNLVMLLARKSILIVLDDLWENDACKLDELKVMLKLGQGRKVTLVTTRDKAIARDICNSPNIVPYKLEILTDDMCWTIIKHKSCFEDRHAKTHSAQIGRDIAVKCGGVALAAQSLGYMLRDMTSDQWESVRDSDIWNLSTSDDPYLRIHEVLASLRLSYSHMHEWLQSCFSYCAVFQKGSNIAKHDLINQWIALELIQRPTKYYDSVQRCEQYITHLVGLSFLQYSMEPSNGPQGGYATFFTMHDLVHDLARAVLADKVNKNANGVRSSYEYAFLTNPSKLSSPENIRALHLELNGSTMLNDGIFSPAKNLLVLDIRYKGDQESYNSIGELKQLRYLRVLEITKSSIPWMNPKHITQLLKLNYLSLRSSNIEELPDKISDVKGLMHLDLSGCRRLRELPVSFAELTQLVYLDLSGCDVFVSESLGSFTRLQYLNLSFQVDAKHPKVPPEAIKKLTKLRYLNLGRFMMSEFDTHSLLVCISTLDNLEHLDLSYGRSFTSLPESIGNLMKLHTLDLTGCFIHQVPACMAKMVNLKIVNMINFDESVFPLLHFASLPNFVVHVHQGECSSNLNLLVPTNPIKLKISKLENVMSVQEAEDIKLTQKEKMRWLSFMWTVECKVSFVEDKDVLEKLVPPGGILTLDISGYRSTSFPTNWLLDSGQYFPSLYNVTLKDLPYFNSITPLGQLPWLRDLHLHRLGSLEELNTADSCGGRMFRMLDELDIRDCPRLMVKPCLPRGLRTLVIERSDNVFKELKITQCKGITSLPGSIHHLTWLRTLRIDNYGMSFDHIQKMFSRISADTDEININEYIASLGVPDPPCTAVNTLAPAAPRVGVRHTWTRRAKLNAAGRAGPVLVETSGLVHGTAADAHGDPAVGDAVDSGYTTKNLSDAGNPSTHENVVHRLRIGTHHPLQQVPAASSNGSRINNSAAHPLIPAAEVDDVSADAVNPSTIEIHGPQQLVAAAPTVIPNSLYVSSGPPRINNNGTAADALTIPADVAATVVATDIEDLIRSFSTLSLEPGS